jgi:hypothetical protein
LAVCVASLDPTVILLNAIIQGLAVPMRIGWRVWRDLACNRSSASQEQVSGINGHLKKREGKSFNATTM